MLEVYAAGLQMGLYMVVINWHLTAAEITYILENSHATAIFAEDRFADAAFARCGERGHPTHPQVRDRRAGCGWDVA